MTRQQLVDQIREKSSYLCIGLDTDLSKIPQHLRNRPNAVVEFNRAIIEATKDLCVSYKINTAFYEALGSEGWKAMEETVELIPSSHFKIADAKRGDIGNTSSQYAKAFFDKMNFDAITVAPYMGEDSIRPFLEYPGKWTIVLGLTSNKGAEDFELLKVASTEKYLYENVISTISRWGTPENLMFVTGATQAKELENIRSIIPDNFLLVPGVGTQGGSLSDVTRYGKNADVGLLVNVSRAVIYASGEEDFGNAARSAAKEYQKEMKEILSNSL